ncbi:alpha/beta hydrolase fold domain-containing protein [Luteolibacter flavescens]|uniref:Alpha/beta hydrolase fold domain-containing protein n=1 Tax=Luteolibacter flavescens TaxID=1859460 RepID=A0ABT3FT82_9BACT|nr:alpha/beta hydrolase fold domain-containing protein [Luteolibacter flavescens]MCW1886778.1 alpha/beta hydrolase fold domain-containing protein [Luteolibacter flavescens]
MRWLLFPLLASVAIAQEGDPFASLDKNKDGKLTLTEIPEPLRPQFPLVDANGDGVVTKEEFLAVISGQGSGGTVAEMEHLKDIDYAGADNPRQKLDLILPKDRKAKKRPMVVFVHGGGWQAGRKEDGLDIIRAVTATGDYAAATINYRLSQEAKWPAQIHDCKAAIRFLRAKADEYGIDADHIGVVGMSAGGHLVSLLGTGNDDPGLEGTLGAFAKVSSRVQCVVNFFGPTDFLTGLIPDADADRSNGRKMVQQLLGRDEKEARGNAKAASPVSWVTKDDAPFFTAHGTKDTLVPYSQATTIHEALVKAGVESHLVAMQGAGHGFASPELNNRIRLFLDMHLRGKPAEISSEPIKVR